MKFLLGILLLSTSAFAYAQNLPSQVLQPVHMVVQKAVALQGDLLAVTGAYDLASTKANPAANIIQRPGLWVYTRNAAGPWTEQSFVPLEDTVMTDFWDAMPVVIRENVIAVGPRSGNHVGLTVVKQFGDRIMGLVG